MRARIVYNDGSIEKLADVTEVTETDERFEFTVPGEALVHYPKHRGGVKFVQVTWHAE